MTQQTDIITDIATMKAQIIEIKGDVEESKMKLETLTVAYYKAMGSVNSVKMFIVAIGVISTVLGILNYLK